MDDKKIGRPAWTLKIRVYRQWIVFLAIMGAGIWWFWGNREDKALVKKDIGAIRQKLFERARKSGKGMRKHTVVTSNEVQERYRSAVKLQSEKFDSCYHGYLKDQGDKAGSGRLHVTWMVDESRKAKDIRVENYSFGHPKFFMCITRALGDIEFPDTSELVAVRYDFEFEKSPAE